MLPQCPVQTGAQLADSSPKGVSGVEIEPVCGQTAPQVCVCNSREGGRDGVRNSRRGRKTEGGVKKQGRRGKREDSIESTGQQQ